MIIEDMKVNLYTTISIEMKKRGWFTSFDVSQRLGISHKRAACALRVMRENAKQYGIKCKPTGKGFGGAYEYSIEVSKYEISASEWSLINELRAEGYTFEKIEEIMGYSQKEIRREIKEKGLISQSSERARPKLNKMLSLLNSVWR